MSKKQVATMRAHDAPISLKLPPELRDEVRALAKARGQSVAAVLRGLLLHDLGRCPTCGARVAAHAPARVRAA